ncbi:MULTISPECIES: tripartite tricarboxylate transporter TctB family protein [unclassified Salipiger]|uniref:tripartite tricarboxylate transporter TctB family protein n=1 Tax=unclassified Salipiger TaxID=2640570 RepID=UPI0013BE027B|nr:MULTISPECIES: tripartite tricarboxylate transporter TctB family protein [unclassified Salipiger]NDV53588.1 tripartite tricarboxylate transporter TctB family protein [Salipiger sp. PrR003]NDW35010.1 tripartite tricarboxylate transporter TctB family protein [Salipiger sp. PrR007]
MRLPDIWTGLGFAILGIFVVLQAQGFPEPAGAASPRLFPRIVGSGFVLFGLLIAGRSLAARMQGAEVRLLPEVEDWMRSPKRLARILFIPLAIVLYGLLAPVLGSLPVSVVLVLVSALLWDERPIAAAVVSIAVCLVVTLFFIEVMRVPLPTGPFPGSLF